MAERRFINEDGTVRPEVIAQQKADAEAAAAAHGIDPERVDALIAEVNEHGYVIIPDVISQDIINTMKAEVKPMLKYSGPNSFG